MVDRRRRAFVALLGGAAVGWPLVARTEEARRLYRLGVLHQLPRTAPQFAQLFDGLRREGFIEGRNLVIDSRGFYSRSDQYQTGRRRSSIPVSTFSFAVVMPRFGQRSR
jgi:putative ABC transport system substrate-binding protein